MAIFWEDVELFIDKELLRESCKGINMYMMKT